MSYLQFRRSRFPALADDTDGARAGATASIRRTLHPRFDPFGSPFKTADCEGKCNQLYWVDITMGYFFRRSARLGPFRLNVSKSGIGASVGVKGARLTMTPRGTTYITVGRNGFYYRESISSGPRSSQPPLPTPLVKSFSAGEIPTADVSELVDSSSEQLVNTLNARAKMFNPAWLVYVVAASLFIVGVGLRSDTRAPTAATLSLAGADYPTVVARYGYPDSIIESNPLGAVPVRTVFYTATNVRVVFVQAPCVSAYENVTEVLSDQKKYPSLAKDNMKRLRPCRAPAEAAWIVQRYTTAEDNTNVGAELAQERFAGLKQKNVLPLPIQVEQRISADAKRGSVTNKTTLSKEPWSVPAEALRSLQGRDTNEPAKAAAAADRQIYGFYGLMAVSLGAFALGIVMHKKNTEKRMSRLFYELSESESQRYNIVLQALTHLAKAHQLWRVEANSPTWDWKRNAGASSLVRRASSRVETKRPPRVQTNIQAPSLNLGKIRLYFMPDLILCWNHGTFGGVAYGDFIVDQGATRFIEDGYVPRDAVVVGQTWRYVRRDGGPDRRFNNNKQLPIAQYGTLTLRSSRGLNIHLQVSSIDVTAAFKNCFGDRTQRAPRIEPQLAIAQINPEAPSGPETQARKVLGVGEGHSSDEISAAYRLLAQMYHPDKVAGLAPEFQIIAESRMKELNAAYELLKLRRDTESA